MCLRLSGMRIVFIVLLFFFAACVPNKYTHKKYSFSSGVTWESLELNTDSSFKWIEGSCTHFGKASGTYIIQGRKLILYSDSLKQQLVPDALSHTATDEDSCLLSFCIIALDDSIIEGPLCLAVVFLHSEADTAWLKRGVANIDGQVSFRIHKKFFPVKVKILCPGYTKKCLLLENPVNVSDTLYINFSDGRLAFLYPHFPQECRILQINRWKLHIIRLHPEEPVDDGFLHPKRIKLSRQKDTTEQ
jgi:hypothetical protein